MPRERPLPCTAARWPDRGAPPGARRGAPTATATARTPRTSPRAPTPSRTRNPRWRRSHEVLRRVRGLSWRRARRPRVVDGRTGKRDHRLRGAERRGEDSRRGGRGVLSTRLHHGRRALPGCCSPPRSPATGGSRSTRGGNSRFVADRLPYFRQVVAKGARPGKETFGAIIATGSLDDSGSMCAALVKARRAGVGPRPPAGDRALERLRRAPAVPSRQRHPRAPAPAARVAVGRRPLHGRARPWRRWELSPATGPGSTTR